MADGIISRGNKMGEGWLLTAEMVELVTSGYENIVCAQPFGCLPNHICGKGMISRIRGAVSGGKHHPIDYDPSATPVNQENRIKLMLSVAKERLDEGRRPRLHGRWTGRWRARGQGARLPVNGRRREEKSRRVGARTAGARPGAAEKKEDAWRSW